MSTSVHKESTTTITTPPLMNSSTTSSSSASASSTTSSSTSSSDPSSISQRVNDGLTSIKQSASAAMQSVGNAVSDFDKQHHISSQVSDVAAHVTTAINRGNPGHALSHATTAAKIGDAERTKHAHGPLDENAHIAADARVEPKEHTDPHPDPSQHKTANAATDMADHVKASLSHGNIIHAAKFANAATVIGEVEREKHEKGPLPEQMVDQPEAEHVNVPAGKVKHTV